MSKQNIPIINNITSGGMQQKRQFWTNFPIVGGIVVVTTVDSIGRENAAPKNWCIPFSYDPPMILFSCDMKHDTAKNILETKEFVVNIPGEELFMKVIMMDKALPHGESEIKFANLTSLPSKKVKPPIIKECRAHAECKLEWYKELGPSIDSGTSVLIAGRIISSSIDNDLIDLDCETRQAKIKQMVAWPDGFATIIKAKNRPRKS